VLPIPQVLGNNRGEIDLVQVDIQLRVSEQTHQALELNMYLYEMSTRIR
jgi:hypothetical protein